MKTVFELRFRLTETHEVINFLKDILSRDGDFSWKTRTVFGATEFYFEGVNMEDVRTEIRDWLNFPDRILRDAVRRAKEELCLQKNTEKDI